MSHRGRLNVIAWRSAAVGRDLGFEDVDLKSILGAGDVKYHLGATGLHLTGGRTVRTIRLEPEPPGR